MVMLMPEVLRAVRGGAPVVALETAVLTHGLPRPVNLEVFRAVAAAVREEGAVPAAVALLGGALRVGLTDAEAESVACDVKAAKVGLADLPVVAARGASGGATVAVSLWAAREAGIALFATGGIGGVHRGAVETFDVSGDLPALSSLGGCVVCSGAKAILDLPKTFETLETLGVPVLTYGADEVPAFTCRDSGMRARQRVDDPAAAAAVVKARDRLGMSQTVVVANPPPAEAALPREVMESAVVRAQEEAAERGVRGKALTPFLLDAVARATGGASLAANRALLVSNARLAARIAVELSRSWTHYPRSAVLRGRLARRRWTPAP